MLQPSPEAVNCHIITDRLRQRLSRLSIGRFLFDDPLSYVPSIDQVAAVYPYESTSDVESDSNTTDPTVEQRAAEDKEGRDDIGEGVETWRRLLLFAPNAGPQLDLRDSNGSKVLWPGMEEVRQAQLEAERLQSMTSFERTLENVANAGRETIKHVQEDDGRPQTARLRQVLGVDPKNAINEVLIFITPPINLSTPDKKAPFKNLFMQRLSHTLYPEDRDIKKRYTGVDLVQMTSVAFSALIYGVAAPKIKVYALNSKHSVLRTLYITQDSFSEYPAEDQAFLEAQTADVLNEILIRRNLFIPER